VDPSVEERLAKNEAFFRQVNERISEVTDGPAADRFQFLCECSDPACTERIELTRVEYEAVRADPQGFVVARGHVSPEVERVVEREERHVIVRKQGLAGRIAVRLDPRTS
jgi:hypothetical protein